MPIIEIYWNDLTKEKQKEILDKLGDNGNFDVMPISTVEFENNEKKLFYVKHTEISVGHFAVYAKSQDDAYDVFQNVANNGMLNFSKVYLTDSENEVLPEGETLDDAEIIYDEYDETEEQSLRY